MSETKKTLVLLDAHAILHRAYHAMPDFETSQGEPTGALYGLSTMILKIAADFNPEYLAACFDRPEKTFRTEKYVDYKAGRAKTEDALVAQLERARDVCEAFGIPVIDAKGFEADDCLGTIVDLTKKEKNLRVIIASGDMDTLQLVEGKRVLVYTLRKGINDTVMYDEDAVMSRYGFLPERMIDFKGLRGDPSDNIPGIKGIGEVLATDLITKVGGIDEIYRLLESNRQKMLELGFKERVIALLEKEKDEAYFSREIATIRKDAPIDFSLEKAEWKKVVDVSRAKAMLTSLEFKSLGARVEDALLGLSAKEKKETEDSQENKPSEPLVFDPLTYSKVAIAAWLIDSTKTNLSPAELLEYLEETYQVRSFEEGLPKLEELLVKEELIKVYQEIELPLIPVLRAAEERGVLIDTAYLAQLGKEYHAILKKLEKEVYEMAGEEFNLNSPKQLGEIVFGKMGLAKGKVKRTATGAISTRAGELEKLRGAHPIIDKLLEYRELVKIVGTYIDPLGTMLDSGGRLHTSFVQTGTETGRVSSQNPNLQNIPIRTEAGRRIRKIFVASPGYTLLAFDYSQIELRVLAILSKDPELTRVFKEGGDVHATVASRVFGVAEDEVTADMRRKAKVINFGIIYGMGVTALRQNLGGTREEAEEFYKKYFENFPAVTNFMEESKTFAKKTGYTETLFGRKRRLPSIQSRIPFIQAAAERQALNAPVQGTAADIMKKAMIEAYRVIHEEGLEKHAHLLLQVHDEIIFEVESSVTNRVAVIVKKAMEEVLEEAIPLVANKKEGQNWGEMG